MKEFDMKKVLAAVGSVAGLMVLIVIIKFLIVDPAAENKRLALHNSENESTIESLRGELAAKTEAASQLDLQLQQLRRDIDALKEQNKKLLESQSASHDDELKRLNEQISSLQKNSDDFKKQLDEANGIISDLQQKIENINQSKNTAYTYLLSTYSTQFSYADDGRVTNLTVASRSISGSIIMPGETFSFFDVVGECTVPKGYKESKIFLQGEIAEGIGGGICQISSTLYNAALLSGMKITERHPHSMKVSYVEPGRDATVNYGYLDLKFVNPYNSPVKIIAEVQNGKVTFSFYSEHKKVKVPAINISVSVNSDGDYVMERKSGGVVDYRNTSHYSK